MGRWRRRMLKFVGRGRTARHEYQWHKRAICRSGRQKDAPEPQHHSTGTQAQQAFRSEPRNLTVRMGATAVLRCEVLRASGTVQWVKDGLLLGPQRSLPGFPRYSMIGNPKRGQYHLQIEKAQLEDDALYECQAGRSESSHAIISGSAWIDVLSFLFGDHGEGFFEWGGGGVAGAILAASLSSGKKAGFSDINGRWEGVAGVPPSKPYFEVDMATPWVAGKKYTVACIAPDAKPVAEITLYKDGVELTGAESFTMSGSKDKLLNMRVEVTFLAVPPQPPVIVGLEREEVKAGRTLILECVSHGGNPLATLHWTKNGDVLSMTWDEDIVAQKSSSVLVLKITPADNQAVLCCESVNLVSLSPLSVSRKITVLSIEGQDLELTCYATSSNPPVQIRWWLGYKELNTSVVVMEEGANGGMTTMSNMTHRVSREEDGLELTCEAFNKGTRFSKTQTSKLSVYYPPQKIWLDTPPEDVPLRSGSTVRLVCFATGGNPTGTLTWFKNGRVVSHAQKQTSFDRGAAREVVLVLTASDNMATYRCNAKNEAEKTISAQAKLMVHYPPEFKPEQPTQVQVVEDDIATIPLLVSANPEELSCIWRHHREKLVKGDSRLCDGSINQVLVELSQQPCRVILLSDAPSVKAEKDPVFVNLGDTADLICVADANPVVSGIFSWKFLGEQEVEMGEETQEDESGLLTIHDVTRVHAGLYQCTADNGIAPPATVDVRLVVQFKPELQKGAQWRKVASRGDGTTTAELVCQAEGIPRVDFSWERNGVHMDFANPRYEEQTVSEGSFHTSTVRVVNVSAALDYAVFSCTARNSLGEDRLDIQLVSTNHPDPPSSFRQVSVTHESVTLEWIPGFNGGLQQRFRIRATFFTVTGLQPDTTYNFSVNALNNIGESGYADNNAVLTITTKEKPELEVPTDDDSVSHSASGLPAYLTVLLAGVFGVMLVFNSLGCYFGARWKKRRGQTEGRGGSVLDIKKNEEEGSSQSTVSNSNKYESGEKINAAAQRTLLIDSGSETDSHVYESYAAVRAEERRNKGSSGTRKREKGSWENMQRHRGGWINR
ncbi:Nephrin Renal glomerulus-specific cell adhesion receptor [Collichthys lucidus]|uniref:Nephrin Renal glomerulus-specific cell adhesion receptor n=1 Tax=Collichthys lucidus TaxID=240159 RepID=A0A4V6ARP6_COLLU|nr:Nephrin Renal glomerulus-specific cell adhesion receptor [Collichthys lucidus]